ncbi:hypothetical protein [Ethanoligenens harbinense]|uniref:Uncharacterized protein n=1 Tax=Ethanoligenens harbinense (strain DSM 18485 / JCM 12961 / CGMCC 1.5033 / YUAN-3) TaxID=663278 RepID=E6U9N4_ETHHY|nr:hypothetical protein [Ethanoligenens harbinense]ADU27320.1 hypothetical protein Ethha_1795 [Ethanoligenens harbinense YUAN-3]AVQ96385.1 hypothetical protein CXQ68_09205 [Ethanoligenens harbinense YUAN-3]AYF39043.1 hypothetical protein CXP51_09075 [Ethanoligenens harbinense]AYF41869.1 hypothetical protein CN246_09645 [Ethanoligenens harbinense]QCN92626.1 hypothetical protein DRA42_09235 [Ethanoligenens harbinense]
MEQEKKERVWIWMPPGMVRQADAAYPLHGLASRSEFVCKAVEFYLGFLQADSSTAYMQKTTLAFLEDQLTKLEARMCRQLFRMCVEMSMSANVSASLIHGLSDETLQALRKKCVQDVKHTVGSIRYDKIYHFQNPDFTEEDDDTEN